MILGINATKGAVFLVHTEQSDGDFVIKEKLRIQHAFSTPDGLLELMTSLTTIYEALQPDDRVAILKCSGGQYGSSVQAIKAETIAELAALQKDIEVVEVAPQSLKKVMGGDDHWRKTALDMFNKNGEHKYWSQGMDGAFCAAYAAGKM